MFDKKSSLESNLDRILRKRGFSLPLVERAISDSRAGLTAHNIITDHITRAEYQEKLLKIHDCGTLFEIREYETPGEDRPIQIIHNGNFCKNPIICPICADRVSRRRRAIWAPRIRKAVKKYPYVYMMVMTIQDGPDMGKQLKDLSNSRKRFRLMGQRRGLFRSQGEAAKIGASTINTEIVPSDHGWHVHDHQLLFCRESIDYCIYDQKAKKELEKVYGDNIPEKELEKIAVSFIDFQGKRIPVSKLSREWHKATRGEAINIKCVPLSYRDYLNKPKFKNRFIEKYEDWLVLNSIECLKYNSKLSQDLKDRKITGQQYADLLLKKGGRRLFNTTGDFRKKDDSLYFDEKEIDRLEYVEMIKKSEYVIRSAQLQHDRPGYQLSGPLNGALFSDSDPPGNYKRYRLSLQGRVMGDYRRLRSAANKHKEKYHPIKDDFDKRLEDYLDRIREAMRARLKEIWQADFTNLNLINCCVPSCLT